MFITPLPPRGSLQRSTARSSRARGAFAVSEGALPDAAPSGITHTQDLSGLLGIQANDERNAKQQQQREAMTLGQNLLKALDHLNIALLRGETPSLALQNLAQILQQSLPLTGRKDLDETLAHIVLRAEVELAKHTQ
jgi:Class II flagellar assembly regulator